MPGWRFEFGGATDEIVVVPSWLSNQDAVSEPGAYSLAERLSLFTTVVSYDQRGTGISDPVSVKELPTLEGWADDLHAVVTAAGVGPAVLVATERRAGECAVRSDPSGADPCTGPGQLVHGGRPIPRATRLARTPEAYERFVEYFERSWGTGGG